MKEVWKNVVGFEGLYQVSNMGNVKSVNRSINLSAGGTRKVKGRLLSNKGFDKNGYINRVLYKNGKSSNKKAHRLVCEAFLPNLNKYPDVNHINGIKNDNRVENLEWVTKKRNSQHALDNNLSRHGDKSNFSKLTNDQVLEVYFSLKKVSEISIDYGICKSQVYNIKNGITGKRVTGHK